MKKLNLLSLLLSSLAVGGAYATETNLALQCAERVEIPQTVACTGVKTPQALQAVLYCVGKLKHPQAVACQGVKSIAEADTVIDCAIRLNNYWKAAACQGVKN